MSEKYGRLTAFNGNLYSYNAATDTITNSGLEIAGNNSFGTGRSDSLHEETSVGLCAAHRHRLDPASEADGAHRIRHLLRPRRVLQLSLAQRRRRLQRPVRRDSGAALCSAHRRANGCDLLELRSGPRRLLRRQAARPHFRRLLPNIAQTDSGDFPAGNLFGPFLFGGYDINNKLPYTENWTFDLQYQAANNWLFSAGYVGNHGVHEVLPIPFQPAAHRHAAESGQRPDLFLRRREPELSLNLEPISTSEFSGNAPIRVPYIGYDMNSVLFKAEGISNYNALQLQVRKRLSNGLQFTASYTWSHALDEQSGLGLFFTGNNPLDSEVRAMLRRISIRPTCS